MAGAGLTSSNINYGYVLQVAATVLTCITMSGFISIFLFRIWSDFDGIPTLVTHIAEPGPLQSTNSKDIWGVTA